MLRISNCPRGNTHISSTTFILVLPVEAGSMPLRHSAQVLRLGNVPSNGLRLRERWRRRTRSATTTARSRGSTGCCGTQDRRNPRNSRWRSSSGSGSRVASFMLLPRRSSLLLGDTPVQRHDLPALPSQLENVHGPQYVGDRPRLRGARKEFRARVSPCHLGRRAQLHRRALHRMPRSRHLGHQVIVAKVLPTVVAIAVLEHDDVVCDQRRNTGHVMVLQSALEAGHDILGRVLWTCVSLGLACGREQGHCAKSDGVAICRGAISRAHLRVPLSRGAVADFDCFEPVALLARVDHDAVSLVEVLAVADSLGADEAGLGCDLRHPFMIACILDGDLIRGDGRDRALQMGPAPMRQDRGCCKSQEHRHHQHLFLHSVLRSVVMPTLYWGGLLTLQEALLILLLLALLGSFRIERFHLDPFLWSEARQVPDEVHQVPTCKLALLTLVAPRGHTGEADPVLDD